MEEVDFDPQRWLWVGQDFSGGSNCRCGGNSKEVEYKAKLEDVTDLLQSHDWT